MVRGKPVDNPNEPYSPNRVQITTMVTPKVREMLKRVKVDQDISYAQAICDAVEAYWTTYDPDLDDQRD